MNRMKEVLHLKVYFNNYLIKNHTTSWSTLMNYIFLNDCKYQIHSSTNRTWNAADYTLLEKGQMNSYLQSCKALL